MIGGARARACLTSGDGAFACLQYGDTRDVDPHLAAPAEGGTVLNDGLPA
jgi:hypothetical protein